MDVQGGGRARHGPGPRHAYRWRFTAHAQLRPAPACRVVTGRLIDLYFYFSLSTSVLCTTEAACATVVLVRGPSAAGMPQSSLQGRGGFTRSTASRRRAPEICDFGPGPGGGFTACPVTVRSPRRPRRRWHPMPNHVANPSPRLRPIKGRCISVYRLPQRRHSPSARCPTARRWHRASDRWRGCICRDTP